MGASLAEDSLVKNADRGQHKIWAVLGFYFCRFNFSFSFFLSLAFLPFPGDPR
jgi:hypothetical protein